MSPISLFLAQIEFKDGITAGLQKTGASRNELTTVFAAVGFVTALLILWALFIRKRPDESSRRYRYRSSRDSIEEGANAVGDPPVTSDVRKEKRKRRRRKHRPRNPTLAETGGLPPIRTEGYLEDPP
jgi:hypothetical protein